MLLVAGSRLPFWGAHPDWGPFLLNEHCFLLTAPAMYTDRSAIEVGIDTPYWSVNPEQMKLHYHLGSRCMFAAVRLLHGIFGERSLWLLKLLGTAGGCLFAGVFSWALLAVRTKRRGIELFLAPLLLMVMPPALFFWFSLLPQGHHSESHVFYALFLPVYVQICRGRLGAMGQAAAGILGGIAVAYVASNLVLVAAAALALLLWTMPSSRKPWWVVARFGIPFVALYAILGRPRALIDRLMWASVPVLPSGTAEGESTPITASILGQAFLEHVLILAGTTGLPGWDSAQPGERTHACVLAAVLAAGGAVVAFYGVRVLLPSRGKKRTFDRFVAIHGWLLVTLVVLYLALDPYCPQVMGHPPYVYYLLGIYPALFVGVGVLANHAAGESMLRRGVVLVALLALGAMQLDSMQRMVRSNDRDDRRPYHLACDSLYLEGFFWDAELHPQGGHDEPATATLARMLDVTAGERRCSEAIDEPGDACAFVGFALSRLLTTEEIHCADEATPARQRVCARAVGAVQHPATFPTDEGSMGQAGGCADEFDGDLYWSCLAGAYTGATIDAGHRFYVNVMGVQDELARWCGDTFAGPVDIRYCWEQSAYFTLGSPQLPPPSPESLPLGCEEWPLAFQGLCERTHSLIAQGETSTGQPSCQQVYLDRYAASLPDEPFLPFESCLVLSRDQYPYCAIGVGRLLGEVECEWSGDGSDDERWY